MNLDLALEVRDLQPTYVDIVDEKGDPRLDNDDRDCDDDPTQLHECTYTFISDSTSSRVFGWR